LAGLFRPALLSEKGVFSMISKAARSDLHTLTNLAQKLWPEHQSEELYQDLSAILEKPDAAFFLAEDGEGFAQCQMRYDYVEGTESSPVGYLEGIYVEASCRRKGLARELLAACENWAREQGCREFASDCELTNIQSLDFHLSLGFEEANRIICFTKKL
jgi:aminoglycoside 6'-N-acetyltransferase I